MKIFKKAVTLLTASVMTVSVCAFTACGNSGGYGDPKSAEEATKVIEQLDKTATRGVSVGGNVTSNGVKVEIDAKANLSAGAFDVALHNTDENEEIPYVYCFMRDWKVYGTESKTEITDFSSATLAPFVDIVEAVTEQAGASVNTLTLSLYAPMVLKTLVTAGNYVTLSLGKVTNSVAFGGNTVTVDYNLAMYNMFNDFKTVIDGVEATTTVGEILDNETIEKYAEIFTELVSYDDLVTYVGTIKDMLGGGTGGLPMLPATAADDDIGIAPGYPSEEEYLQYIVYALDAIDTLLETVKPDAGSTTYEYLVKLLKSDEVIEMINSAAGEEILEKKLTEYSILDIVSLASGTAVTEAQVNEEIAAIKENVAEVGKGVTKESITIVDQTTTIVESGIKYTFTYNDEHVLLSQGMEASVSSTDSADPSADFQVTINLTVSYSGEAFTLAQLPAKLPEFSGGSLERPII